MPDGGNFSTNPSQAPISTSLNLSDSAARRIEQLMAGETTDPAKPMRMRIAVAGGGCSGFQYSFSFDSHQSSDDRIFAKNGAELIIDETSLGLMNGATLDFVEDLAGSSFQIKNPLASSGCGCGNSFALA
ncbi:MAG: iron-sulfur cluster assembly accessory protein [Candidatus Pacebacteria bacterium]|nr:iron-sulfur cluster assembly accessory protein [Candidatus Paceibacterota bacterium]